MKFLGRLIEAVNKVSTRAGGRLGFYLFCYPVKLKMKDGYKSYLRSGLEKYYKVDGNKIAKYKWGRGQNKILLLHGWGSNSFRWKELIEYFDKDIYTLVAIDGPAHGLSSGYQMNIPLYGKAVDYVIREEGSIEAILGHSIGGHAALYTQFQYKHDEIKKLVIMGAPGEAMDFLKYYQSKLSLSEKTVENINETIKNMVGHGMEFYSTLRYVKEIKQELFIIHDKGDKDVDFKHAINLHENASNSRLELTDGFGHKLRGPILLDKIIAFLGNEEKSEEARGQIKIPGLSQG